MATSGIGVSPELSDAFASAVESNNARFIKVGIKNETLVPEGTYPPVNSFEEDLKSLQEILADDEPAYILARLDGQASDWLAIHYVPEVAKIREKMLYASTRGTLTKSLGSTHFSDSIFATTKADLTPSAYAAHRTHVTAPKPLSAREQEMQDIKAAEREAGGGSYEGMRARRTHVGAVGLAWSEEVETAVKELDESEGDRILVLTIDTATETLVLSKAVDQPVSALPTTLPPSEPAYAFVAWGHNSTGTPRRDIVFIYSCPSSSPVKNRMIYSLSANAILHKSKSLITSGNSILAPHKIETSDPKELDEKYLIAGLGLSEAGPTAHEDNRPFARPKGPRKR